MCIQESRGVDLDPDPGFFLLLKVGSGRQVTSTRIRNAEGCLLLEKSIIELIQ